VNDPDGAVPPGARTSATLAGDSDSVPGVGVVGVVGVVGGVVGGVDGGVDAGVDGGREPGGRAGLPGGTASGDSDVVGVLLGRAAASDPGGPGVGECCPWA